MSSHVCSTMEIVLTKRTKDEQAEVGVGIYNWQDGAMFQNVMNQEMGKTFPYGMDPTWRNDEMKSETFNVSGLPVERSHGGNARDLTTSLAKEYNPLYRLCR